MKRIALLILGITILAAGCVSNETGYGGREKPAWPIFTASTYTPNLNLEKPADGDPDWGEGAMNPNFDTIDTAVGTKLNADGTFKDPLIVEGDMAIGEYVAGIHFNVKDVSLDISDHYIGASFHHKKVAGDTDENIYFTGLCNFTEIDDADSALGHVRGATNVLWFDSGEIGAIGANRDCDGTAITAELHGGTIHGNAHGLISELVQEAANTITGNAYGLYLYTDMDGTVDGTTYMLYLDEKDGVDYGIYQAGTADNYFGGNVGIGVTDPQAKLDVDGVLRIRGGTPVAGKYLKATNADGDAVWDTPEKHISWIPVESDISVTVADGKWGATIPVAMNGMDLTAVIVSVHTKGVTDTTDVQLRRRRNGANADMLSTKITIGDEYYAADGVIDTSNDDLATGDQIYIDVDAIHSGTAPLGLSITLTFE